MAADLMVSMALTALILTIDKVFQMKILMFVFCLVSTAAVAGPVATRGYLNVDRYEKLQYIGFNSADGFTQLDIHTVFKFRSMTKEQYDLMVGCTAKKQTHAIYVEETHGKVQTVACVAAPGYFAYWSDRVEKLSWSD